VSVEAISRALDLAPVSAAGAASKIVLIDRAAPPGITAVRPRVAVQSEAREVVATSASPEYQRHLASEDLVPLDELIAQTAGAHPIGSIDELRCDVFDTDDELDEFLASVTESRHADLA
jgi:hypothetical protein